MCIRDRHTTCTCTFVYEEDIFSKVCLEVLLPWRSVGNRGEKSSQIEDLVFPHRQVVPPASQTFLPPQRSGRPPRKLSGHHDPLHWGNKHMQGLWSEETIRASWPSALREQTHAGVCDRRKLSGHHDPLHWGNKHMQGFVIGRSRPDKSEKACHKDREEARTGWPNQCYICTCGY